jgi:hypothetical protein
VGSRPALLITKRVHSTRSASDKAYQLLVHGRWFSPDTLASSTTKTGRHDIAEILLKVALNTININLNPAMGHSLLDLLRMQNMSYFCKLLRF